MDSVYSIQGIPEIFKHAILHNFQFMLIFYIIFARFYSFAYKTHLKQIHTCHNIESYIKLYIVIHL